MADETVLMIQRASVRKLAEELRWYAARQGWYGAIGVIPMSREAAIEYATAIEAVLL